jgi:hypothetical protein
VGDGGAEVLDGGGVAKEVVEGGGRRHSVSIVCCLGGLLPGWRKYGKVFIRDELGLDFHCKVFISLELFLNLWNE